MVQVPMATNVTVAPDTVQAPVVCELKLTARPDDAVALTVNGAVPSAWFPSAPNVMVWVAICVTVICSPRSEMWPTRADVEVFAAKEKPTAPLAMVPMVSQPESLLGA